MDLIIFEIFKYQFKSVKRYFRSRGIAKLITIFLFLILIFGVGIVIYLVTKNIFVNLQGYENLNIGFYLFIFENYFTVLFFFIVASSIFFLLFSLFRKNKDNLFVSSPNFKVIPGYYLIKTVLASLIPHLALVVPVVIGLNKVFDLSYLQIFFLIFNLTVLMIIAVIVSMTVLLICGKFLLAVSSKNIKLLNLKTLTILCLSLIFAFTVFTWKQIVPSNYFEFWGFDTSATVEIVVKTFGVFPSHPTAMFVFNTILDSSRLMFYYQFLQLGILITLILIFHVVSKWFFEIWQVLQDGSFVARVGIKNKITRRIPQILPRFFKSQTGALLEKEFIVLKRNMKDFVWLLIIVGTWIVLNGIIVVAVRSLSSYGASASNLPSKVYVYEIAMGVYFITALVLRFLLPSFSTERRTAWILGTVPIKLQNVLYAKLFSYGSFFILLGLVITIFNAVAFDMSLLNSYVFGLIFITQIIAVSILGIFLGIIFPSFDSDDAEALSTSIPGLLFTFISILYGGLGALVYSGFIENMQIGQVLLFLFSSIFIGVVMLKSAPYFLRRIEFIKKLEA
ncbi:hypothetical protein GF362_07340 [Candidatus Dojkabacteria bacterium]|nr:hypothetical protein [Candidatus Dojkabacteria bacterium]